MTFSKFVKMNGRLWEVNFRRQPGTDDFFFGDTPDLKGDRIEFLLQKGSHPHWELNGRSLPDWFRDALPPLTEAVETGIREFEEKHSRRMRATA